MNKSTNTIKSILEKILGKADNHADTCECEICDTPRQILSILLSMESLKEEDYKKYEPYTDERYALDARNEFRKSIIKEITSLLQ